MDETHDLLDLFKQDVVLCEKKIDFLRQVTGFTVSDIKDLVRNHNGGDLPYGWTFKKWSQVDWLLVLEEFRMEQKELWAYERVSALERASKLI